MTWIAPQGHPRMVYVRTDSIRCEVSATLPPTSDEVTAEARTFFERGVTMFRRRRYDAALTAFTAAYRFSPLPEVIYNLAVVSERTEHLQDAIDYYREYLRAMPTDPDRATIERTSPTVVSGYASPSGPISIGRRAR